MFFVMLGNSSFFSCLAVYCAETLRCTNRTSQTSIFSIDLGSLPRVVVGAGKSVVSWADAVRCFWAMTGIAIVPS